MSETESTAEVRGVLLPLQEGQLLLPNAAVCEVVSYRNPEPAAEDRPEWVMGAISWRNHHIPLVSYERLLGVDEAEPGHRARVAICNTLNGDDQLPYIGILLRSAPHLVRVTESGIQEQPAGEGEFPMVVSAVTINGVNALIPDLDALELALTG